MALIIGSKAPDFKLPATNGKLLHFYGDIKEACILYFYPKDFTPGCIKEACQFRDEFTVFEILKVPVFGISRDSVNTHERFKEKYNLPFELLSDPEGIVIKNYKAMFPVINMPRRITYLVDKEKKILAVFENLLNAKEHIKTMKIALKKLTT